MLKMIGSFFMGWVEPILEKNHTGVATMLVIVGIGIISTFNTILLLGKVKAKRREV